MNQQTVDEEIDAAIAARSGESRFVLAPRTAWLDSFEKDLPFRLPPSYRSLLLRYRFPSFEASGVSLFGNLDGKAADEFVVAAVKDPIISSVTRRSGFIQIGRPASGAYDPICFDLRSRSKTGEAAIVRLDHEEILIANSIRIVATAADSFLDLLASGKPPNKPLKLSVGRGRPLAA